MTSLDISTYAISLVTLSFPRERPRYPVSRGLVSEKEKREIAAAADVPTTANTPQPAALHHAWGRQSCGPLQQLTTARILPHCRHDAHTSCIKRRRRPLPLRLRLRRDATSKRARSRLPSRLIRRFPSSSLRPSSPDASSLRDTGRQTSPRHHPKPILLFSGTRALFLIPRGFARLFLAPTLRPRPFRAFPLYHRD